MYIIVYTFNYNYIHYIHIYLVMLNPSQYAKLRGSYEGHLRTPPRLLVITGVLGLQLPEGLCLAIIDLLDDANAGEGGVISFEKTVRSWMFWQNGRETKWCVFFWCFLYFSKES